MTKRDYFPHFFLSILFPYFFRTITCSPPHLDLPVPFQSAPIRSGKSKTADLQKGDFNEHKKTNAGKQAGPKVGRHKKSMGAKEPGDVHGTRKK